MLQSLWSEIKAATTERPKDKRLKAARNDRTVLYHICFVNK